MNLGVMCLCVYSNDIANSFFTSAVVRSYSSCVVNWDIKRVKINPLECTQPSTTIVFLHERVQIVSGTLLEHRPKCDCTTCIYPSSHNTCLLIRTCRPACWDSCPLPPNSPSPLLQGVRVLRISGLNWTAGPNSC